MTFLSDYLFAMLDKAKSEGHDDRNLNWYLKPATKEQLAQEIGNVAGLRDPRVRDTFDAYLSIEVNPIFTQAPERRHRYLAILGEINSEWALGLTATGLIEEVKYAY